MKLKFQDRQLSFDESFGDWYFNDDNFGMVQAKSTSTSYQEGFISSKTTKAKISSRLMKQFQQDDQVTFLIKKSKQIHKKWRRKRCQSQKTEINSG
ncbi:hypothetical protein ACEQPO_12310 [Bacillus sp. SL00103]